LVYYAQYDSREHSPLRACLPFASALLQWQRVDEEPLGQEEDPNMKGKAKYYPALLGAVCLLQASAIARAQEAPDPTATLRDAIAESPGQPGIDTALVFTNRGNTDTVVAMKVWNHRGEALAGKRVKVPAAGLAYLFASEIAQEHGIEAFLGKIEARAQGHVVGTSVVVGVGLSDVPAVNQVRRSVVRPAERSLSESLTTVVSSHIVFPVVATY
jgi:hypothetical protein